MDMGKRKFEYEFAEDKFDSRKKTTVLVEQSSSPFLALPVELVYRILDNLDQFTIFCSARNVCVRLNTITDTYHRYQAPTALNLSSSQIGNKKAQLLADALRNNTTLTTLDLWENLIGETGAQHLADALRINTVRERVSCSISSGCWVLDTDTHHTQPRKKLHRKQRGPTPGGCLEK
ncbi:unnamed protein product [Rotaria socialis]|uniref:F-box domain-containing protein n=1 Tax=Rotaria socialis TaxID=392032 RepID=A0A820QEP0_9BILA|nr:unnamed protein product [Rotaria socialis]CAF4833128.1 unnamed protein product [Rotaria socialis]